MISLGGVFIHLNMYMRLQDDRTLSSAPFIEKNRNMYFKSTLGAYISVQCGQCLLKITISPVSASAVCLFVYID